MNSFGLLANIIMYGIAGWCVGSKKGILRIIWLIGIILAIISIIIDVMR